MSLWSYEGTKALAGTMLVRRRLSVGSGSGCQYELSILPHAECVLITHQKTSLGVLATCLVVRRTARIVKRKSSDFSSMKMRTKPLNEHSVFEQCACIEVHDRRMEDC